jgi:hypothetical protein
VGWLRSAQPKPPPAGARQGSFKYQHDTDKDLIKMHVFPRVKALPEAAAEEAVGGDMPGDCARLIVSSPLWSFKELVTTNAPSFIQHKALHKVSPAYLRIGRLGSHGGGQRMDP